MIHTPLKYNVLNYFSSLLSCNMCAHLFSVIYFPLVSQSHNYAVMHQSFFAWAMFNLLICDSLFYSFIYLFDIAIFVTSYVNLISVIDI